MKRLLVLGAGFYSRGLYPLLRDAGFLVHALDRDPAAPCAELADEFQAIDFADAKAVLDYSRLAKVDGIMPTNEFGTRSAAFVANELGLPGISPEAAERATDKGWMRDCWERAGIPNPKYRVVASIDELVEVAEMIGYPCVLKPTDSGGGGRGISVVRDDAELQWAFNFASPYADGRLIVESFLDGVEVTVESISHAGRVTVLGVSDKYKPELRTRVATSLNYPARLTPEMRRKVEEIATAAVRAVGVDIGMAHTELIVTGAGPVLVELGARGGGAHLFHTVIEAASGVRAPVLAAQLLTGSEVEVPTVLERGACYRFFDPPRGILKAVHHLDEARQMPGVLDIGVAKRVGDQVGNLENSLQRAGFVVAAGKDRAEAMQRADAVEQLVQFEVETC